MAKRLLAGLDIGTTGCKVTAFDESGAYLGRVYRDYAVDITAIWDAVQSALREAVERYPGIIGLGVTSFGETFVAVDGDGEPVFPIMLYTDPRGKAECAELVERLGEDFLIRTSGVAPHPMYSLPKVMWLKKNEPEVWARVKHIFLIEDYIVWKLTGVAQIDYSLATRTMAFDIHKLRWSEIILDAAGIDSALFSNPVPTGTAAGFAKAFPEMLVVSVSHDQVAAAIGSGVFDSTAAVDGAGTVECVTPVFRDYDAVKMAVGSYAIVPYLAGQYVCYAFSFTGGALVKWYMDTLAKGAFFEDLESGWTDEPTGLLVLPHFAGAATPYMDPGSKGAILGLSVETTERDIYKAILEGITLEMRLNMERLADAGVTVPQLRATGGGANSKKWLQLKADILNVPVTALAVSDAGAAGSAMLVGVAAGVFSNLQMAAKTLVRERETFTPRESVHEKYLPVYERYKKLYDAVRPLV